MEYAVERLLDDDVVLRGIDKVQKQAASRSRQRDAAAGARLRERSVLFILHNWFWGGKIEF